MKRGWIAVGLIIASLIMGVAEYIYTSVTARIYTDMLNEADARMENNEVYEAQSMTERLDHRFNEDKTVLNIFSFHSDVNAIGSDLAALRRYAQTGSTAEFLAQSAQAKRRILALSELRAPRIENIF